MMMLIIKAQFRITDPVNSKLFEDVAARQSKLKPDLKELVNVLNFLKSLRDIYRLTTGATDNIVPEALQHPAKILGYPSGAALFKKFKERKAQSKKIIKRLQKILIFQRKLLQIGLKICLIIR